MRHGAAERRRDGQERTMNRGTDNEPSLGEYAWYDKNSEKRTHPVGQKKPNGLGLCDMSGNVWEWVNDRYDEKYYSKSPEKNPQGPLEGTATGVRGGSWFGDHVDARCAYRSCFNPVFRANITGFRCARTL
jgi:formylglycine-generating enzyme required for sulfatase activity